MKYYKLLLALCAMTIVASILVFLFMKKDKSVTATPVSEDAITKADQNLKASMWENYVPYIIEDDYKQLSPKSTLTDTINKVYSLNEVNSKKYKLVVRYSYIDCETCVNAIMKQISAAGEQNSIKDAIAITTSTSDRDFLIRARETQWPIKLYNVTNGDIGLYMENKNFPFMFVLTPDGHAIKIFTPAKEIPAQIKQYIVKTLKFVNESNRITKI